MTYYCISCDETNNLKTKRKHLKSKKHKYLEDFIIMGDTVENPEHENSLNRFTIYPFTPEYALVPAPEKLITQLQLLEPEY